jgi:hypothetical protein
LRIAPLASAKTTASTSAATAASVHAPARGGDAAAIEKAHRAATDPRTDRQKATMNPLKAVDAQPVLREPAATRQRVRTPVDRPFATHVPDLASPANDSIAPRL